MPMQHDGSPKRTIANPQHNVYAVARRGSLRAGEKVQFTDRKGSMITVQLRVGGVSQTRHGLIEHDLVIGSDEGVVVATTRSPGSWKYVAMRPRLCDYVLSMPRGAQIMYPKDIAQVIQLGDIRSGMRVLESGAGSGALSINLLDAVGQDGTLTTIEMRSEFARVARSNARLYFGRDSPQWNLVVGEFGELVATMPARHFDRVVLDMLDPWNRVDAVHRVIAPGGVLSAYVTTTTQLSRLVETLRSGGSWTEPEIQETLERHWKVQGLAVRPEHEMIGHTGFLVFSRAMAEAGTALDRRVRTGKREASDVDDLTSTQRKERIEDLELRDISDRKLRKVLRDLDEQIASLPRIGDDGGAVGLLTDSSKNGHEVAGNERKSTVDENDTQ